MSASRRTADSLCSRRAFPVLTHREHVGPTAEVSRKRHHSLATDLATDRTFLMKFRATGLRVRFFSVKMPTGSLKPRSIGNVLSDHRSTPYRTKELGTVEKYLPVASRASRKCIDTDTTLTR